MAISPLGRFSVHPVFDLQTWHLLKVLDIAGNKNSPPSQGNARYQQIGAPNSLEMLVLAEFVELRGGFGVDSNDLDLLEQLFAVLKKLLSPQKLLPIAGLQQKLVSSPKHFDDGNNGCGHHKFTDLLDVVGNSSVTRMGPRQGIGIEKVH
jgi:hypothetical protein